MSDKPNTPVHPLLDFLPESVIALNMEVSKYHTHLFKKYPNLAAQWGTVEELGILAAECSIVVDGTFDEHGVDMLANLITERLVARRSPKSDAAPSLILPPGFKK